MNVFDKFFIKYGYKFPKGYPDMNNEQDILLLESLLNELVEETINLTLIKEDTISDLKKLGYKDEDIVPISRNKIKLLVASLSLSVMAIAQSYEGSIEFKMETNKDTTTNIYYVKGNDVKLDQIGRKSGKVEGSFVFNLANKEIKFVNTPDENIINFILTYEIINFGIEDNINILLQ
jgi:hypothetical protein